MAYTAALLTKYKGPEMEKPVLRPYTPTSDEDAKGFLWSAHSGVNRIDGSEFETFTMHDGFNGNRP